MPAFAPLLRADLLLRAALVVGGGLRAPRCTRAAPNGVFVRAFMVAKRRGKLEMGSIEAEVIRTSYWVSAVQGADVHGAGQQQREPRSARRQHEPHAIRQQPPQKALRHHTFGRGIFGSRSFFVSGSPPEMEGGGAGQCDSCFRRRDAEGAVCPAVTFSLQLVALVALRARGHVGAERAPAGAQPPARARRRGTKAPSTKCAPPPQPTLVPARACARLRVLLMAPPPLSHRPPDALCQPQHTHVQGFSLSAVRPARRRSSRAKSARRRLGRRRAAAACAAGPWPQRRSLSASAGGALSARPPRQRRRQRWGRRWITWLRDSPRESGTPRPA